MKTSVLLCCLFLVFIHGGRAAVSYGLLHTEEVYGRTVEYCEYGAVRFLKGKRKLKDYAACVVCTCSDVGMSCESMSPTINPIGECIVEKIRCKNVWLRKNNPYRRCPKRLQQIGSMLG